MKILHLNDHYSQRGGVEQYILAVGQLLTTAGHKQLIAYTQQNAHTLPGGWHTPYATALNRLIAQEKPDLAYVHHLSQPELLQAVVQQLPTLSYVHGFTAVCPGLAKQFQRGDNICERAFGWGCVPMHYLRRCSAARHPRTLYRLMQKTADLQAALKQCAGWFVASNYMRQLLIQNGFNAQRIALLPPHFIYADQLPAFSPPTHPQEILYVGRLEREKGLPYLLQAVAQMPAAIQLHIAGDGSLRRNYEQLADKLGVAQRVHFRGWLSQAELSQLYQRCAVLVIPTIFPEPFGKVGIEALAYGRPVVAFRVGGIADWLTDGENGYFVPAKSITGLAERVTSLIQNPVHAQTMGKIGREKVLSIYTPQHHLQTLLTRLEQTLMRHVSFY